MEEKYTSTLQPLDVRVQTTTDNRKYTDLVMVENRPMEQQYSSGGNLPTDPTPVSP